jgi:hypothetical protein
MPDNDNIINLIRDEFKHVNDRLDAHYQMFQEHSDQDARYFESFREEFKLTNNRVNDVETDLKVAKRVGYILSGMVTAVVGWLGFHK